MKMRLLRAYEVLTILQTKTKAGLSLDITGREILFFSAFLFYILIYIEETLPVGQLFTLASVVLMLVFYGREHDWDYHLHPSLFLIYILAFAVYTTLSMAWATDPSLTAPAMRALYIILIMMTAVYICHYRYAKVGDLLKVMMYGGYTVVFYSILRYGWTAVRYVLSDSDRLTNELLNANTLGMCAAYAIVINFYFIIYDRIRIRDILMAPSLLIILASGSRKAFVIVAAGVFALLILRNMNRKDFAFSALKIAVGVVVFIVLLYFLLQLPMFAGIAKRLTDMVRALTGNATRYNSAYARMQYMQIGMEMFRDHPLLGAGIYNSYAFIGKIRGHVHLHNNFVELLACGGIVGFGLYYSIYVYILGMFWKLRRYRDGLYDICLILFVIRLVMGFGHVQFKSAATYFFLMVTVLELRDLKRKRHEDKTVALAWAPAGQTALTPAACAADVPEADPARMTAASPEAETADSSEAVRPQTAVPVKKRKDWIDALRALAMLLVIWGHIAKTQHMFFVLTSAVKVPLFFAVTGYVFNARSGDVRTFFQKLFRTIIVPWLVLSLIWLRPVVAVIRGRADLIPLQLYRFISGKILWFMPCIILSEIIYFFIRKWIKDRRAQYIAMAAVTVAGLFFAALRKADPRFAWLHFAMFDNACIAQGFLLFGYWFRSSEEKIRKRCTVPVTALAAAAYVILIVVTMTVCGGKSMDVHTSRYYSYWVCPLLIFTGMLFLYLAADRVKRFPRWIIFVGRNTLVFYICHYYVRMLWKIGMKMIGITPGKSFVWYLMQFVVVCAAMSIASLILNRWFPWAVGKRKKKA